MKPLIALLLLGLLLAPVPATAQGQLYSNSVYLRGANSGGTPSLIVYGTDQNISLTLVPKGTGTVTLTNFALASIADPASPATGQHWLSTTTANVLKYADSTPAIRSLVDLSLTQTLTNKTLTAPVLSGTVTGTYTLGGTPTIASPTVTGVILAPDGTGLAPPYAFTSNNGGTDQVGMWKDSTNTLGLGCGATGSLCGIVFRSNSNLLFMVGGASGNVNVSTGGNLVFGIDNTNNIGGSATTLRPANVWVATAVFTPAISIGATPTAITQIRIYSPSLTPGQLAAAIGVSEQTFTVTGLSTADNVIVNGPAPQALCPPVTYRVSATNTIAIGFVDLTAALCTPTAGTYVITAIRS